MGPPIMVRPKEKKESSNSRHKKGKKKTKVPNRGRGALISKVVLLPRERSKKDRCTLFLRDSYEERSDPGRGSFPREISPEKKKN